MANEGVNLNPRKLKYLYLMCTVVVFAFMLYLYLPYNGRVVKNLQHARMFNDNDSSLNNKSLKLATLRMQVKNGTVLDLGINETAQFKAILMEPIILNYPRNIYITVKTTHKNYANRLPPLMLTWLQTVDKSKISIITDRSPAKQVVIDNIRKAGFHIVDTECAYSHELRDLSCKAGFEHGAYYEAVEAHPDEKDSYQWYCHFDDDIYVNILQLSQLLQQYDSHKPYYVGKWPAIRRPGVYNIPLTDYAIRLVKNMNYDVKRKAYTYATGAAYCISYTLMMEAKKFFSQFQTISTSVSKYPDDMTVGFVVGILLGYNLTDAIVMTNEYDKYVYDSTLKELITYVTVSSPIIKNGNLEKLYASLKTPFPVEDKTKFLLFHCILYPTVSWCQGVREIFNTLDL